MLKFFIMFLRRFFFIFTLISLLSLISPVSLSAQSNILKEKQDAINKGTNQESWLNEAMSSNIVSTLQVLTGPIPDAVLTGQAVTFIPGGALGTTTNLIASLYSPPASGIEYLADLWHSKFLGKPAYAQGIGFKGLQPILPLWRGFRNVVYLLSSIVFVVIGIMIILRVKISPQAVVTVQNAIPQLITTLILVTFSYAIAGLLIDLIYLIQGMFIAVIFTSIGKNLGDNLLNSNLIHTSFPNLNNLNFGTILYLSTKNISLIIVAILGGLVGAALGALVGFTGLLPLPIIGQLAPTAVGALIGGVLFILIIAVFVLISIIKLLFGLIKCYISVIVQIILSPLSIGLGAFPGSKFGFSTWITEIIANLSVFPIVTVFLVLVNVIAENSQSRLWAPQAIGVAGNFIPFIIAFGGLLLVSKLPELIPQVIFSIKPSPWSQAISQSVKEVTGTPAQAANLLHIVSGVRQDVSTTFPKRQKKSGQSPERQPQRAANLPHQQTQVNQPDIPDGPNF